MACELPSGTHSSQQRSCKPTLILNGDLLELALAEDNIALMAFERFIELMFPTNGDQLIDGKIILIPGNHDHHLWEAARETQYVEFLQGRRSKKPLKELPSPWHTTKMLTPDLVDSCLLNAVIHRHSHLTDRGVHVGIVYPNLCLLNDDESKCVIFSHGHFVESIYTLMTTIGDFVFPRRKAPEQIWGIETENFAWIDFFWSAMGRSGEVGKDVERIYDMLQVPESRSRLIRQFVCAGGRHWFRRWPKLGERLASLFAPIISKSLKHVGVFEKTQVDNVLTQDAREGLKGYIEGPLAKQIAAECRKPMQAQTTFVFGHTHKPFSVSLNFATFPRAVSVYNSGGWVVDTMTTEPIHGGAIVLVDQGLNVVSVRMYNEVENQRRCPVKVEALDGSENPLYAHVAHLIKDDQDPWLSFSKVVAENVDIYHKRFRDRLNLVNQKK